MRDGGSNHPDGMGRKFSHFLLFLFGSAFGSDCRVAFILFFACSVSTRDVFGTGLGKC
jgi:hypothetical protein